MRDHHRFLLGRQISHVERLEQEIAEVAAEIERRTEVYEPQVRRLEAAPGIDRIAARSLIAEIGPEMSQFASFAQSLTGEDRRAACLRLRPESCSSSGRARARREGLPGAVHG